MSEWISVKEQFPIEREPVLAYFSDGERRISWWFKWGKDTEAIWIPGIAAQGKVTHWHALPESPK